MKNRAGCVKWGVVFMLLAGALGLVVVVGALIYFGQRLPRYSSEFTVPMVIVSEPVSGTSVSAKANTVVISTSSGSRPIARVELWLDGALKATQNSQRAAGDSPFESALPLAFDSAGPHMLFVRAIDTAGLIGQSQPVTLVGGAAPDPTQMTGSLLVDPGQTYANIATSLGTDATRLQQLNPGLGGQQPAAGSIIKVPLSPQEAGQAVGGAAPSTGGSFQMPDKPTLKVVQAFPFWANLPLSSARPAPPDGLNAQMRDCRLQLRWNDNSTNETGYEVWVSAPGLLPLSVAKLQASPSSGPASADIAAPQAGSLNVWVEALDSAGSQPSNIVSVSVNPSCLTGNPTELQVEALDMKVPGSAGNAYCYLSLMNAPHLRVPANDGEFIQASGGQADIASWATADHKLVVPVPSNGVLPISGSCLAWEGSTLVELGSFQSEVASAQWDGKRLAVRGDAFEIGLAVNPLGGTTMTTFDLPIDPVIPPPYDVTEGNAPDNPLWKGFPPARMLHWKWDGDPNTITGFRILFNGQPVASYNYPDMRDVIVRLPASCGRHVRWEVVAYGMAYKSVGRGADLAPVQSSPSNPVEYEQPKCNYYLVIKYEKLSIRTTDEEGLSGDCPTLEAYYALIGPHQIKKFYYPGGTFVGGSFFAIQCFHTYSFYDMGRPYLNSDPQPDILVAPIDDQNIHIWWGTMFFDYDGGQWFGGSDDWFADVYSDIYANKPEELVNLWGCGTTNTAYFYDDAAKGSLTYTISVVPNSCTDVPPYVP